MINNDPDPELKSRLDELMPVPPRDQKMAVHGRAKFLNQAMKIEETVSAGGFLRHISWIPKEKEKFAMNILVSVIVVAGLLFGGGATVNAAQDDLPGEPLYSVKTASEDISLQFQQNAEEKVDRLMELTQVRIQEMAALTASGQTPPDQVRLRLEQHIQQALQTCINMDDATLDQTLLRLRDQLQSQDRDMEQLQLHATNESQQILERTRAMLRLHLQLVEEGVGNREAFRNTVRDGFRFGQDEEQTPPTQNGNGQQNGQPTSAPNGSNTDPGGPNTNPGGPNLDVTPGPNDGDTNNGSGPGPGSGNGSGGDDSNGNGSGGNGTGGNGSGGNRP